MRTITITLDANDTPKSVYTLAQVAGTLPDVANETGTDAQRLIARKLQTPVLRFSIYAESENDVDVNKGPARIGFDSSVARNATAALRHGDPVLPGIGRDFDEGGGSAAIYSMKDTYITGKLGDVFQLQIGSL